MLIGFQGRFDRKSQDVGTRNYPRLQAHRGPEEIRVDRPEGSKWPNPKIQMPGFCV